MIKKPIISAINGKALGGGFLLALLSDFILASEKSYFSFPEINLGIFPGLGATQRFTKLVGEKKAMRYILSGKELSADEVCLLKIADKISS